MKIQSFADSGHLLMGQCRCTFAYYHGFILSWCVNETTSVMYVCDGVIVCVYWLFSINIRQILNCIIACFDDIHIFRYRRLCPYLTDAPIQIQQCSCSWENEVQKQHLQMRCRWVVNKPENMQIFVECNRRSFITEDWAWVCWARSTHSPMRACGLKMLHGIVHV